MSPVHRLPKTILQGRVKGGRRQSRQRKRWEDNIWEWTGLEFAKSQRAMENREKWRKLVAKSSVVPQQPSQLRDRSEMRRVLDPAVCTPLCFVLVTTSSTDHDTWPVLDPAACTPHVLFLWPHHNRYHTWPVLDLAACTPLFFVLVTTSSADHDTWPILENESTSLHTTPCCSKQHTSFTRVFSFSWASSFCLTVTAFWMSATGI